MEIIMEVIIQQRNYHMVYYIHWIWTMETE